MTTRIDIPADSTDADYYPACHAAQAWLDPHPKTGASLFEPSLAMLQASPSGPAGTRHTPSAPSAAGRLVASCPASAAGPSSQLVL
ncbi:lipoprotein LpqV, partial [Mycobacterium avium]|uniref:lipoprotein LpqV n=1 Tax=Mycobacterium avium TaxID=1764 RepID=UPI001F2D646D